MHLLMVGGMNEWTDVDKHHIWHMGRGGHGHTTSHSLQNSRTGFFSGQFHLFYSQRNEWHHPNGGTHKAKPLLGNYYTHAHEHERAF